MPSIHVHSPFRQNDSSQPPLTVGPIKGWMFWSDSLKQSFTWTKRKKKRTYHNAINHVRASGFSWCHVQLQKALLIKFDSFCVELCVKSLKIWSGTGAGSCCSKRRLSSFAWPLKLTQRLARANFCISIRIAACWGISSLGIITDVRSCSHFSFLAQFLQKF